MTNTRSFRKRKIIPTQRWYDGAAKLDEDGQRIPILDLYSKTENLSGLPLVRALHQKDYLLFSVHTIAEDSGFIMSFQIWKPFVPTRIIQPTNHSVVDDESGFRRMRGLESQI